MKIEISSASVPRAVVPPVIRVTNFQPRTKTSNVIHMWVDVVIVSL